MEVLSLLFEKDPGAIVLGFEEKFLFIVKWVLHFKCEYLKKDLWNFQQVNINKYSHCFKMGILHKEVLMK